jgi:hypothetical protein
MKNLSLSKQRKKKEIPIIEKIGKLAKTSSAVEKTCLMMKKC